MKYNFDEVIDRSNNRSSKYDERKKVFGTDDVIPMWVADMDFRTAQPIIDACVKKAQEGIWGYTSRPASYFEAVQAWEEKHNGYKPDTAMMSWTIGVVSAMASLIKLCSKPEDKVLFLTPVYAEFYDITENTGRTVVESEMVRQADGSWKVDMDDFAKKAKEAKIFLLCNPHNPLGKVWTPEELKEMVDICIANDVLVISDEIHSDLIFHGKHHTATITVDPSYKDKVVTCVSATKTFNLAGLQSATVIFPNKELKDTFDHYWFSMDIHRNNAFSSVAMEAAYRYGQEWLDQLLPYISANFDYVDDFCKKYIPQIKPNCPDATYLMWLDCRDLGMDDKDLVDFFIHKAKLGLNAGYTFGRSLHGYMRLNVACPRATLEKAMKQLKDAVDGLKK